MHFGCLNHSITLDGLSLVEQKLELIAKLKLGYQIHSPTAAGLVETKNCPGVIILNIYYPILSAGWVGGWISLN